MFLAVWTTLVLFVGGLATAMTLVWRRHVRHLVPARCGGIDGSCSCYPRLRR